MEARFLLEFYCESWGFNQITAQLNGVEEAELELLSGID